MRSYFAISGGCVFSGSLSDCLLWSKEQYSSPIKLLIARPEEKLARIIGEVENNSFRLIAHGRTMPISKLKKAIRNGKKEK